MQRTRVIQCGAGVMGRVHAGAYVAHPDAELVAVLDPAPAGKDLAGSLGVPHYSDLGTALASCPSEIVDLCVPTFLHEGYAIAALDAGRAVLCEKPMALTEEAAVRMSAAAERAGRQLMVAQTLRFWPEYVAIAEAWRAGRLGEQVMGTAVRLRQLPGWSTWYGDPVLSGGGVLELHVHDIDVLVHLFGPVREVRAIGWKNSRGAWNHVVTAITFAGGARAVAEGALEMPPGFPHTSGLRVVGTAATLEFTERAEPGSDAPPECRLVQYEPGHTPTCLDVPGDDPYALEIGYFVDRVRRGLPCDVVPTAESVHVIAVMAAIRRALDTGTPQVVPDPHSSHPGQTIPPVAEGVSP